MIADADTAARAELARYRAWATGLLLLMAALAFGAALLPPGAWPHAYWTRMIEAAARAGVVGGIADWFAITALFRHPLGLPIPHTAIIPRQKARLGAALGRFVANQVFTEADVAKLLARLDLPELLRSILEDPATSGPLAAALAGWLPRLLAAIEDGGARRLLSRLIPRLVGGTSAGLVVARMLRGLVAGGRHQDMLGFVLEQLRAGMGAQEVVLKRAIEDRVREQGGRLIGWAIGGSVAKRVLHAVNAEFDKMAPASSELRAAFDAWARQEIERIEQDPDRAAEIGRALRDVVSHGTVQAWLWDVWARLRQAIEQDAADPSGRTATMVQSAIAELGRTLAADPLTRGKLDNAIGMLTQGALPGLRAQLAAFIGRVVGEWDSATITDRLEVRVGKDLQFVRINGTVVGFVVGGALYAFMQAVFGRGS